PPAVVRCLLRVKTPARTILTCDASPLAGLPPGVYRQWEQEVEILPTGRVVVPGTSYLAGSGAVTEPGVGKVIRLARLSLREAVDMASGRPRQLLGFPAQRLEVGARADLMLFDWEEGGDLRVRATLVGDALTP